MTTRPPGRWLRLFGGGSGLVLPPERAPHVDWGTRRRTLAGARGVAVTDLHPSGTATVDGVEIDVVTTGDYVDAGEAVVVTADEGYRRVVRRVDDTVRHERAANDGGATHGPERARTP